MRRRLFFYRLAFRRISSIRRGLRNAGRRFAWSRSDRKDAQKLFWKAASFGVGLYLSFQGFGYGIDVYVWSSDEPRFSPITVEKKRLRLG